MAYGLTEAQRKGIKAEIDVIPELIRSMEAKWNCQVSIERSDRNTNMNDKIDYFISIQTPVRNVNITADYKNEESFTLYDHNGKFTIGDSKAGWIIKGEKDSFLFINTDILRNSILRDSPKLYPSKNNNSKYFWLSSYLAKYSYKFDDKNLFSIPRI